VGAKNLPAFRGFLSLSFALVVGVGISAGG
jgi:hypothetical protein